MIFLIVMHIDSRCLLLLSHTIRTIGDVLDMKSENFIINMHANLPFGTRDLVRRKPRSSGHNFRSFTHSSISDKDEKKISVSSCAQFRYVFVELCVLKTIYEFSCAFVNCKMTIKSAARCCWYRCGQNARHYFCNY